MLYKIIVEKGDGSYCAYLQNFPALAAVGKTKEEAISQLQIAFRKFEEVRLNDKGNGSNSKEFVRKQNKVYPALAL